MFLFGLFGDLVLWASWGDQKRTCIAKKLDLILWSLVCAFFLPETHFYNCGHFFVVVKTPKCHNFVVDTIFMIVAVCVTLTEEQCPVVLSKLYDLETIWYPFYHLWWCYCVLKPMEFSTLFLIFLKKWNVIFECWRYYRAEQQSTVHVAFVWNKPILSVSALQIEIESC